MEGKQHVNSLMSQMENALDIGRFISYNEGWNFIQGLEDIKKRIDYLVENGEAGETIHLYEMFLSGCYEKADEIDDSSGSLGMFFEALFCSWVRARQKAECSSKETIYQILKWMDNDDYGFCYNIEKSVVKVLNRDGLLLFEASIQTRFDEAFLSAKPKTPGRIYDYPFAVRHNADILKVVYIEKEDIASYVELCEKIGTTPRDCENIATLHKNKSRFQDALVWVDEGLELEVKDNWPNESSYALNNMKRELLDKLGRREDAFESAWAEFKEYPSENKYDESIAFFAELPDAACQEIYEHMKSNNYQGKLDEVYSKWHKINHLYQQRFDSSMYLETCMKYLAENWQYGNCQHRIVPIHVPFRVSANTSFKAGSACRGYLIKGNCG